jgi:hypothetical protein
VLPPRDLVDPFVEVTPNHWYWLAEFHNDGEGPTAIFPWAPPRESSTQFVVARLLWCWENDGVGIKRLILENTCGLATCINPRHWRYANTPTDKHYTLGAGTDARLLEYPYHPNTVHIVRSESLYAMCGVSIRKFLTARHKVITCDDCLKEWRGYGRPLEEIKPP